MLSAHKSSQSPSVSLQFNNNSLFRNTIVSDNYPFIVTFLQNKLVPVISYATAATGLTFCSLLKILRQNAAYRKTAKLKLLKASSDN